MEIAKRYEGVSLHSPAVFCELSVSVKENTDRKKSCPLTCSLNGFSLESRGYLYAWTPFNEFY